jgi:opacity protein-like surface antigen
MLATRAQYSVVLRRRRPADIGPVMQVRGVGTTEMSAKGRARRGLAAIAALACMVAAAQAADLSRVTKAPTSVRSFDWSGFFVGAEAGYGLGGATTGDAPDFDVGPKGGLIGLMAGYNHQFANRIVAGIEADAAYADFHDGSTAVHPNSFSGATTNISHFRVNAFGTVRGRVGYAFDNLLPYVTGGFAWARTRLTYAQPMTLMGAYFSDASDADASKLRAGWAIGTGIEYAVGTRWSVRAEYLYLDFGNAAYPAVGFPAFGGVPFDIGTNLTVHTFKAALAYRF